jgi:hypothetical protein
MKDGRPTSSRCCVGGCLSSFQHTPWSDSTGPGLLTVQDAEPSEDVTVIVDEDAVDGRLAGWSVGCDVPR